MSGCCAFESKRFYRKVVGETSSQNISQSIVFACCFGGVRPESNLSWSKSLVGICFPESLFSWIHAMLTIGLQPKEYTSNSRLKVTSH